MTETAEYTAIKILLIDDDQEICSICKDILDEEGYAVDTVANGEDAIKLFQQNPYDIIFIDIFLPDIEGFDVLKYIKSNSDVPEIVLFSGFGNMELVIRAMREGASDFLNKPFNKAEFLKAVKNAESRFFRKSNQNKSDASSTKSRACVTDQKNPTIEICAFGNLLLKVTDRKITVSDWPSHKTSSVFRLLLINHKSSILIDTFIDKLWPDAQRRSAEVMLYSAISTIRYFLEPDLKHARDSKYLKTVEKGYELNLGEFGNDYYYDVEDFEYFYNSAIEGLDPITNFANAISVYKADLFLNELYEDWTFYPRQKLKDEYLHALQSLSIHQLESNNIQASINYSRMILEADNTSIKGYELLIDAYLKSNRISEAYRVYQKCKDFFEKEFNLPFPEELSKKFTQRKDN